MAQPKSAAQSLWPGLPSSARPELPERKGSVGDALWPQLSREAKAKEHDQRLWDEICKRQRESFRQGMREARMRERG
jgi:hypothetical protein